MSKSIDKTKSFSSEDQAVNDSAQAASPDEQIVLFLKLVGILGLLGGLIWALDKVRVQ